MFSQDGKAMCIYLPLTDKHLSYRIYNELQQKVAELGGAEAYHIAGLPVAEVAIVCGDVFPDGGGKPPGHGGHIRPSMVLF